MVAEVETAMAYYQDIRCQNRPKSAGVARIVRRLSSLPHLAGYKVNPGISVGSIQRCCFCLPSSRQQYAVSIRYVLFPAKVCFVNCW